MRSTGASRHAVSGLGLLCVLLSACDEAADDLAFRDTVPERADLAPAGGPALEEWEVAGEWGSLDGPLIFGYISDVALSSDTVIAVAERQDCRVVFIDVPADSVWSVGRCGSGPGEFRNITSITFQGRFLWVFDIDQARFTLLDPRSTSAVESVGIHDLFDASEVASITNMAAVDSERVLLALFRRPPRADRHRELVVAANLSTHEIEGMGVGDPNASALTDFAWAPYASICAGPDGRWAAGNQWTTQVRGYSGLALEPEFDVRLGAREWWTPTPMQADPNRLIPPLPAPDLICTPRHLIINYKRRQRIEGRSTVMHSRLVITDWTGTVVHDEEVPAPADGSMHALTLADAAGDLVVAHTTLFAEYPIVRLLRLPPVGAIP